MSRSSVGHGIKYWRAVPRDKVMTPPSLAKHLTAMVPIAAGQSVLEPFRGTGHFFSALPYAPEWCEIDEGRDFYEWQKPVDWIVSNPPYSELDKVLAHTLDVAQAGFAYLLAVHAITPRRLENIEAAGFGLSKLHLLKVFKWYGMSAFCVFEKGRTSIVGYDRIVWRDEAVA